MELNWADLQDTQGVVWVFQSNPVYNMSDLPLLSRIS